MRIVKVDFLENEFFRFRFRNLFGYSLKISWIGQQITIYMRPYTSVDSFFESEFGSESVFAVP